MKKLLILLYPAAWRARYGAEMEALMEDAPARRFDVLKGALAMRLRYLPVWAILPVLALVGAVAGWVASYGVKEEWRAKAAMQLSPTAVREGGPAAALNEEILKLRNSVMSRRSMSAMIVDPALNLHETERRTMPLEDVVDEMRKDIQIAIAPEPTKTGARVFTISFDYPDPNKARDTVNALITRLIGSGPDATTQPAPFYLVLLDAPTRPNNRFYPKQEAFATAGGIAGLVVALLAVTIRRRMKPELRAA